MKVNEKHFDQNAIQKVRAEKLEFRSCFQTNKGI
jgi:hypothetical protein